MSIRERERDALLICIGRCRPFTFFLIAAEEEKKSQKKKKHHGLSAFISSAISVALLFIEVLLNDYASLLALLFEASHRQRYPPPQGGSAAR